MRRIYYLIIMVICGLMCCACGSSAEHTVDVLTDEIIDQTSNIVQMTDENVLAVKKGHPNSYPDITYEDAFEAYFGDPTWKSFVGTQEGPDENGDGEPDYTVDNVDVVEFTGYCMYQNVKVKALIQFALDNEEGTFTSEYLSFNDVPQNMFMLYGLIEDVFDDYKENHSKADANVTDNTNKSDVIESNDTITPSNGNYEELMDSILLYYSMLYATNNVDAELDHEDGDTITFRLFDPSANTTSNTLGFYEYSKKTEEWTDAVTGETLNFNDASDAHNERLDTNNTADETIPEYFIYVNAPDGYVNLREGPGTEYGIICSIPNGEALEMYPGDATAKNGKKWVKVAFWTEEGWKIGWVIASQMDF